MTITTIILASLMSWTDAKLETLNFADAEPPTVELVAQVDLNRLYVQHTGHKTDVQIGALFDPFSDTIFLSSGFDVNDFYDQSLLVHEIAHYFQDLTHDLRFASDLSRFENEAYRLQASFLKEKGLQMEALLTEIQGSYSLHSYIQ